MNSENSNAQGPLGCDPVRLRGKRAAVVMFSHYPGDPRPRRAAETLVELGMKVEVISLKQNDREPMRETVNGVGVLRIPLQHRRGGKFAYAFQYGAFLLASFLLLSFRSLSRRYGLVHVHNMPDILVFAAMVPKLRGAKVILDLHDPMPELMMTIFGLERESPAVRLLKRLENWSITFSDAVLTVNLACKKLFSARSCPPEKVHVIMNSPDEGIFRHREPTPQVSTDKGTARPFVVMYHGSLVERHGLDLAISALDTVKRSIPNAELRIYGRSAPFLDRIMSLVRGSDLEASVRYLGARKLEQIVDAIDDCDLGIIPNRRSVFTEINTPTRIFEYLSRGKPVIAPSTAGIQDYFGPQQLIFFAAGDTDDLAEKIKYAFSHPEEVRKIVRRGQEVYLDHKWSRERRRFVGLVDELIGGASGVETQSRRERLSRSGSHA